VSKTRLETFSDGVIAILITIMVLELRPPDHSAVDPYHDLKHAISSYILSFVVLAIYWNNHRHMMQLCTRVNGPDSLGEHEPALLAVAHPLCHGLDQRSCRAHFTFGGCVGGGNLGVDPGGTYPIADLPSMAGRPPPPRDL
jgi:hypothetical protein